MDGQMDGFIVCFFDGRNLFGLISVFYCENILQKGQSKGGVEIV